MDKITNAGNQLAEAILIDLLTLFLVVFVSATALIVTAFVSYLRIKKKD